MQEREASCIRLVDVGAVMKQFDGDVSESAPEGEAERRLAQVVRQVKVDGRAGVGRRGPAT